MWMNVHPPTEETLRANVAAMVQLAAEMVLFRVTPYMVLAESVKHLWMVVRMGEVPIEAQPDMGFGTVEMPLAVEANMHAAVRDAERENYRAACKRWGDGDSYDESYESYQHVNWCFHEIPPRAWSG